MNMPSGNIVAEEIAGNQGPAIKAADETLSENQKTRQALAEKAYKDYVFFIEELFGKNTINLIEKKTTFGALNGLQVTPEIETVKLPDGKEGQKLLKLTLNNAAANTQIDISPSEVRFKSADKKSRDFTMDDAMRMALVASQNPALLAQGIKIEGTRKQRLMIQSAINAVNQNIPDEKKRLKITNPTRTLLSPKADFNGLVVKGLDGLILPQTAAPIDETITGAAPAAPETAAAEMEDMSFDAGPIADVLVPMAKKVKPEDQIILSALSDILKDQSESKLRNTKRLFEKNGASTGHNVYQITTPAKLPSEETANLTAFYIVKDGKPVIAALTKNDEVVLRHNDIYLKNDIHHPKHPSFGKTTEPEKPIVATSFDKPITVRVSSATYGPGLMDKFAPAVDHHAAVAKSSARAAAAVEGTKPKGPAPIGPI